MTSAPFPPSATDALGLRARRLGGGATATAAPAPSSSPGLRPGSVIPLAPRASAGFSGSAFFRFTAAFLAAMHQSFVKRHECASLPSRTRLRKPDDLIRNLRRRFPVGVDLRVRATVELLALLLQLPHARHRVVTC